MSANVNKDKQGLYKELSIEDLMDHEKILKGDNWFDSYIENDLRDIVKALRANGINTTSSCQHGSMEDQSCMLIDCQAINVMQAVNTTRQIFAILKIKEYWINAHWYPVNGYASTDANITIKIKKSENIL